MVAIGAVVAIGVSIAVVARSVGPLGNRPRVSPPPPLGYRPNVSPPPPPGRSPTPLREVDPATAADEAKGVYNGPLGEFLVTPQEAATYPPCPKPFKRTQNFKTSELYSPLFGENREVYECGNGKIIDISVMGGPAVGRRYFVGQAKVPYVGPFDRLVLLTVGGYPAIAQLPHPAFPQSLRLAVIQRFPSSNEPGILVWVDDSGLSLKDTAALAAQIMGVRP